MHNLTILWSCETFCMPLPPHIVLNSSWQHLAATKSILYPKTLSPTLPGIAGLHCKIAASSVLYVNEKNIYYYPDYLSGLSRARIRFFPTIFLEMAVSAL